MQLGLLDGTGGLDERHSAMSRNMSWSKEGTPLGKALDPKGVFDTLVATGAGQSNVSGDAAKLAERRRALDLSALDALKQETQQLQLRLGKSDRERLDQFLTGTRELEQRTSQVASMTTASKTCQAATVPTDLKAATTRAHVMNDLIVMALKCDVTRVIPYMLDNSRSDLVYNWVGRHDFEKGTDLSGTATAYHESQHQTGVSQILRRSRAGTWKSSQTSWAKWTR